MTSIGSVSVDVVPDARGFHEKLAADTRNAKVSVKADLDDTGIKARIAELGKNQRVKVGVDLADRGIGTRLDELARTRTAKIRADVDRSSFNRAQSALSGISGELFSIKGAALTLGPALIPVTAAVAGLTGALAAPIVGAGAGLGIFGVITGAAISKATKDAKQIEQLTKQAKSATDPKAAKAFQAQADALTKSLPKSELAFIKAKDGISKGFDELLKKSGGNVFGPLSVGANLVARDLPKLSPIIDGFGRSITNTIREVGHWADSGGLKGLVSYLSGPGLHAFQDGTTILGHLAKGAGSLVRAFTPLGSGILDKVTHSLNGFDNVGKSKGLQSFLDYVRTVGPKVARTAGDVAKAVARIVTALAPQGSTVLGVLDHLARTVAKMKPGEIAAVAAAVGTLGLATGKFSKLTSLSLLVSATSYAYKHSGAFRSLANDAGALAKALNSLPTSVKIGGLAAVGAGLAASRGKSGIIGTVANKVLSSVGVQKVYVVNPGFGSLGKGNALAGAEEVGVGAAGLGVAGTAAVVAASAALAAGTVAAFVKLTKVNLAPHNTAEAQGVGGHAFRIPTSGAAGSLGPGANSGLQSFGDIAAKAIPSAKNFTAAVAGLDSKLAALKSSNPAAALADIQSISKKTGLSFGQLNTLLPRSTAAFGTFGKAVRKSADATAFSAAFNQKSMYSLAELADQTRKVGISSSQTAKMLHSLPKFVQTKIETPGALQSRASIKALGKQFGLTPKQIRTIITLVGARDAQDKTKATQNGLRTLNQTTAKPKVLADTAPAQSKIAGVSKGMRTLNQQTAKPKVTAVDNASGTIGHIKGEIAGVKNKTVTITTNHVDNITVNHHVNNTASKPKVTFKATGGTIVGPGTGTSDSIPAMLSNGEEVINAKQAAKHRSLLKAINAGVQGFAAGGTVGAAGNRNTVPALTLVLRGAQRELNNADHYRKKRANETEKAHKAYIKSVKAMGSVLDKSTTKLKTAIQARKDYGSTVSEAFVSDPFGGTLSGFKAQVAFETKNLRSTKADLKTLARKGLGGALYKGLAASGNYTLIDQFAHESKRQLAADMRGYNVHNAAAAAVGSIASTHVYAKAQDEATAATKALTHELHALRTGKHAGSVTVNFNGAVNARDTQQLVRRLNTRINTAASLVNH